MSFHFARCRVCENDSSYVFSLPLLGRQVQYFDCGVCGYLQTQTPDWLDEAYAKPINEVDTGIMLRNQLNVGRVVMTLLSLGKLVTGKVIDHAGGYGILVRMLRDLGVDARWRDKYCENLFARGFEANEFCCDLVTSFEVFEHLVEPMKELSILLEFSPCVLLSTDLIMSKHLPNPNWWYFGSEHGQHIGFFRQTTFRWMADKLNCHYASCGSSLHLISKTQVPRLWAPLIRLRWSAQLVSRVLLQSKTRADFDQLRKIV